MQQKNTIPQQPMLQMLHENNKEDHMKPTTQGITGEDWNKAISLIKRANLEQLYFLKNSAIPEEIVKRNGQKY